MRTASSRGPAWFMVLGVALVAIVVRWVVLRDLWFRFPLFQAVPDGFDMHTYDQWARDIVSGDLLARRYKIFYYAPLYPYLLALVYALAGVGNLVAAIAVNAATGVLAAMGVALLGLRLFDLRTGWVAGILMALNGAQVAMEIVTLNDSILAFLATGSLLAWWWVRTTALPVAWHLLPGFLLGIFCLARGSHLLVLLGMAGWLVFEEWPRHGARRWRSLLAPALVCLGALVALAPALCRNKAVGGRWALTSNGPVIFYMGNAPGASGVFLQPPQFESLQSQARKAPDQGAFWREHLLAELRATPGWLPRILTRKSLIMFNGWDPPDNLDLQFLRHFSPPLRRLTLPPWVYFSLLGGGLVSTWAQWRRLAFLHVFLASLAASLVLTFVIGRYRLPIYPVLSLLGAHAVVFAADAIAAGRREWMKPTLGLAAATLLAWPRDPVSALSGSNNGMRGTEFLTNARALRQAGRSQQALQLLDDGIALFPGLSQLPELAASFALEDGDYATAVDVSTAALRRRLVTENLLVERASGLLRLGMLKEAEATNRALLRLYPGSKSGMQFSRILERLATDGGNTTMEETK